MKKDKINDPVVGDTAEYEAEFDEALDDGEPDEKVPVAPRKRFREKLPRYAIYARYILPVLTGVASLVLSFLYAVRAAQGGKRYEISAIRLYWNTLNGTRTYLGGETVAAGNAFYGLLSAGAIVGMLLYLLAMFLAVWALVQALRAFHAPRESEADIRAKILFKIAFPNRACLFIANLLFVIPALYPEYFSAVGARFLQVSGSSNIYVLLNRPLIVIGVLTLLTLILSILISPWERRQRMNMFLIEHPEDEAENEEENEAYEE